MSRCRNLTKKEQQQVLKEVQALADKYNVSLVSISNVIAKVINPYGSRAFRMPEEKKLKHMLPEAMVDFITAIPNLDSYRVYEVRDMVIEKFPDSGLSRMKIYSACHYLMNKEVYKKTYNDWRRANKEMAKAHAKASWERRDAIRKETNAKYRKGESNG